MRPSFATAPLVAATGIASLLLVDGCASTTPSTPTTATSTAPSLSAHSFPPAGATWAFAQRNTGSFGKDASVQVTRRDGTFQGGPAVLFPVSTGATIVATPDNGNWRAILGPNGAPVMTWDPPIGFQYPLQVGRAFSRSHEMALPAANRSVRFDYACRVDGFGDVAVPAGTFKAYEVGCTSSAGSTERFWYSPDLGIFVKTSLVRAAGFPLGAGTQESELVAQTIRR
jgi:hypothetical protein